LLDDEPQYPDRPPYVERSLYDEGRSKEASDSPPSARLIERYGGWPRACRAAWGLLSDIRSFGPADPWSRPPRRPELRRGRRGCERGDALRRVRTQTVELRVPLLVINRCARERAAAAEADTKERRIRDSNHGSLSAGETIFALALVEPLEEIKVRVGGHRADANAIGSVFL
jgi:hypothetical protein